VILSELRDYLAVRGRAPLSDMAARFEVDEDALRAMLEVWIHKGRVRRIDTGGKACGGCCGCATALPELYEWVGRRTAPADPHAPAAATPVRRTAAPCCP
jgi:putative ferrous iron transport protein C